MYCAHVPQVSMNKPLFEEGGEALEPEVASRLWRPSGLKRRWQLEDALPDFKPDQPDPDVRAWVSEFWRLRNSDARNTGERLQSHVAAGRRRFAHLLALQGELPAGVEQLQEAFTLYGGDE